MTGCKGEDREERLQLLADGDLTHQEIADKQGVSLQAIHEFSARHAAEWKAIRAAKKQKLQEATAHMWVTDAARRTAVRQRWAEDIDATLDDEELDPKVRGHLVKAADHLLQRVAEDHGQLVLRKKVEMDVTPSLATFAELVRGEDGNLYGVRDPSPGEGAGR